MYSFFSDQYLKKYSAVVVAAAAAALYHPVAALGELPVVEMYLFFAPLLKPIEVIFQWQTAVVCVTATFSLFLVL